MPRAAAPLLSDHAELSVSDDPTSAAALQQDVVTTLLCSATPSSATTCASEGTAALSSVRAVALAFLGNLSGGAACYDVDTGLIALDALTDELVREFGGMRRLMAFADTAEWTVTNVTDTTAVIVATATAGAIGTDEGSTDTQAFTLHVDLGASPRPITRVVVHSRYNTSLCVRASEE